MSDTPIKWDDDFQMHVVDDDWVPTSPVHAREIINRLQARYDADIAMMNQRLIDQDANYLRRLQAKTQREGFVPVEVLRDAVTRAGKGTMNGMETWHFRAEDVETLKSYLNSK